MNISVVIPIYPPHFKLIPNIINNLLKSTLLPNEIILALSEINQNDALELCKKEIKLCNENNVLLIITADLNINYAGGNRNRGFKFSTGEIITFIDIDDETHIQKIEIIKNIFTKISNIKMLLHNYSIKKEIKEIHNINNINIYKFVGEFSRQNVQKFCNDKNFNNVHRGHATFHRSVLEKINYKDNMRNGQDSEFTKRVYENFNNTYLLDVELVNYKGSNSKPRLWYYQDKLKKKN